MLGIGDKGFRNKGFRNCPSADVYPGRTSYDIAIDTCLIVARWCEVRV
jgi:hypothetical protein